MSLMSRGMAFVAAKTVTAAAVTVIYTSQELGGGVPVAAVVGEVAEIVPGTNPPARAEHRERDYLITVAALAAHGMLEPPRVGDTITESINGADKTFEVIRKTSEPGWRYSDPDRTTYRIHTKPVG